jgi:exopolyphosphatase / guanosine-5'-triphosphate,3'-diphosphate pyrophosphatase
MISSKRIRSAIDIGTNTVLLLVAEQDESQLIPLFEAQEIPRLGKGVDSNKTLAKESMLRVVDALKKYKSILENQFPLAEKPIITATSAVRDASNRTDFMNLVYQELGYEIRLLSGNEEAEWTFAGALSVLTNQFDSPVCVLDIGGGSTELAYGEQTQLIIKHSFDMGSVRFTERFLQEFPVSAEQIESVCNHVKTQFSENEEFSSLTSPFIGIGVAGTVTTMAFIEHELNRYDSNELNGMSLSLSFINEKIEEWRLIDSLTLEMRYPEVLKGRADIILAGLIILKSFMDNFKLSQLLVSTGGIRHGALLKTF